MKKIIILLLAFLMSACSASKPSETLSSMQTEPTVSETTVAETAVPEETTDSTSEKTETVIEAPKEGPTAPPVDELPEQNPTLEITTETITETPVEPVKTEMTTLTDKDKTLSDAMEDIISDEFTDLTVPKEESKIKQKPVRSTAGKER